MEQNNIFLILEMRNENLIQLLVVKKKVHGRAKNWNKFSWIPAEYLKYQLTLFNKRLWIFFTNITIQFISIFLYQPVVFCWTWQIYTGLFSKRKQLLRLTDYRGLYI